MFKNTAFAILIICFISEINAQQSYYSVNNAIITYNPAFTGSSRCPGIQNGNSFLPGANYYSGYIYADAVLFSKHSGGIFLEQQLSPKNNFRKTELKLNYSFSLPVTRNFSIKSGLYGSYNYHSFSDSTTYLPYSFIPGMDNGNSLLRKSYFDMGSGILGFGKNYFAGISFFHILRPEFISGISDTRLSPQINLHGSFLFGKNASGYGMAKNNSVTAMYIFQTGTTNSYAAPPEIITISYERKISSVFSLGTGWTRMSRIDLAAAKVSVKTDGHFSFYYQYNLPLTKTESEDVNIYSSMHETGIGYNFYCKPKKRSFRTVSCPSFGGGGYGLFSGYIPKYSSGSSSETGTKILNEKEQADTTKNTEEYERITDNPFKSPVIEPVSTFSADVDRASYTNVKRMIGSGLKPEPDAVRIEEFLNYFDYDYPEPQDEHPFSVTTEYSDCPWNKKHKLLLIGIKGKNIPLDNIPASHLVFLIDVSGSMNSPDKLPLVKQSLKLLIRQIRQQDKISIVTYEEKITTVLSGVSGVDTLTIMNAIDQLTPGNGTNGGEGLQTAYKLAEKHFITGGNNRIILATDGDFNIGITDDKSLEIFIERKRKSGIYMSALGFGYGNYKDSKLEKISDKGNGNYAYINEIAEARKSLVNEFGGTLFTIANDVKIQTEINPSEVESYRLIGYENRLLKKEDFKNDKVDAGDIGINHSVTALYEIIPVGEKDEWRTDTMYKIIGMPQAEMVVNRYARTNHELMVIKLRYKIPGDSVSRFISVDCYNLPKPFENVSENFKLASSLAAFGMTLRNSPYKGESDLLLAEKLALDALSTDKNGWRKEYLSVLDKSQKLIKK